MTSFQQTFSKRWASWDRQPQVLREDQNKAQHPRSDPLGYGLFGGSPYERRKLPINDFLPRGLPTSVYVPLSPFAHFPRGLSPHGSQILETGALTDKQNFLCSISLP